MTTVPASLHALLTAPFEPPPPVVWQRDRWRAWADRMGDGFVVPEALGEQVERTDVAAVVDDELDRGRTTAAFVAAMVWALGDAGDGAYRTASVLGGRRSPTVVDPDVVRTLDESARTVRESGPDAVPTAHRAVRTRGLHGLVAVTTTTWLHFASARRDPYGPHAAPVLDDAVRGWLASHADLHLHDGRTGDYVQYTDRLVRWGRPFGRTPVQVESAVRALVATTCQG